MSKKLKEIKKRFINTMVQVSEITGISLLNIKRDEYVRTSVDHLLKERLNKEELNLIGGFKEAKALFGKYGKKIQGPKILIFDIENQQTCAKTQKNIEDPNIDQVSWKKQNHAIKKTETVSYDADPFINVCQVD